ncbi:MAG: YitT family protein [Chitinophagales bacterium]|nr:YitT family protein [Chitinophagales bacterium]
MASTPKIYQLLIHQIRLILGKDKNAVLTHYEYAKGIRMLQRSIWHEARSLFLMAAGITSAAFGLESFLIPTGFIDGGVTGISLLIQHKTGISLAFLLVVINLPFIALGWRQIGSVFGLKSIIAISVLAMTIASVHFPIITNDKLLVSVFGGFFLGLGIGLAIRGGGVIDGTEILAIYLSRKRSLSVGDFILIFNIIIFSVAAYLLTPEVALYSVLTYMAASKTVDFVLEGIEEYTGVTIISTHSNEIVEMIKTKMGHGLTIYSGKKGFGKSGEKSDSVEIIFTVITRLEITRLSNAVERIDPNAFMVMQSIKDTRGGMVKKRMLK